MNEALPSSISVDTKVQIISEATHLEYPTWGIIIVLVIIFFVLKWFIYIKDEKRDGK